MAAAVISVTKPTDVRHTVFGNKKIRFFDVTADTGDYAADGFVLTAAQFGLDHIDFAMVNSIATQGTDGASACGIGLEYLSSGTSLRVHLYESAASGAPFAEKGAEAYVANFTFRIAVVGH